MADARNRPRKTATMRTPLTVEESRVIERMFRERMNIKQIARAKCRSADTVRKVLREAGLIAAPAENAPATRPSNGATITLVGFQCAERIDWYRRKFGAHRVVVAPAAKGKLYAWDEANG